LDLLVSYSDVTNVTCNPPKTSVVSEFNARLLQAPEYIQRLLIGHSWDASDAERTLQISMNGGSAGFRLGFPANHDPTSQMKAKKADFLYG